MTHRNDGKQKRGFHKLVQTTHNVVEKLLKINSRSFLDGFEMYILALWHLANGPQQHDDFLVESGNVFDLFDDEQSGHPNIHLYLGACPSGDGSPGCDKGLIARFPDLKRYFLTL